MSIKRIETQEEFDTWLENMHTRIDTFLAVLPDELKARLDMSVESFDDLEKWLLEHYETSEALTLDMHIVDGAGSYVGETFRKHLGGVWGITLDNEIDAYQGIPCLYDYNRGKALMSIPPSPWTWVTTTVSRRTPGFLRSWLQVYIDDSIN